MNRHITPDPAWRALSLEDRRAIAVQLRAAGWAYRRIADALDVSTDTACRWSREVQRIKPTRASSLRADPGAPAWPLVELRIATVTEETTRVAMGRVYDVHSMPPDVAGAVADLLGRTLPTLDAHDAALARLEAAAGLDAAASLSRVARLDRIAAHLDPATSTTSPTVAPALPRAARRRGRPPRARGA